MKTVNGRQRGKLSQCAINLMHSNTEQATVFQRTDLKQSYTLIHLIDLLTNHQGRIKVSDVVFSTFLNSTLCDTISD